MTHGPARGDAPHVTRTQKRPLFALALLATLAGCGGPPVTSTIEGEPVCPDFTLGAPTNKMRGGLRNPVRLTVLDGKNAVARAMFVGKRAEGDQSPPVILPDGNSTYTLEWAQCENERAAIPLGKASQRDGRTSYECGEGKIYKTEPLTTKKGDPSSHKLVVPAPPNPACWKDEQPAEEPDAGPPDAAAAPDAEAPDASAADAEAPDASTADAGAKPAQ